MFAKILLLTTLLLAGFAQAKVRFSFQEEEIPKVIDTYSKYTGEKFLLNGSVRGRITITAADDLSNEEAYNLLSSALAINGYAISKQGDVNIVLPVHELQRNKIETTGTLPAAHPERMVTYVYTTKNNSEKILKDIQSLISKDGDVSPTASNGKVLLITDWSSNLQRISAVLEAANPPPSKVKKSVAKKEVEAPKPSIEEQLQAAQAEEIRPGTPPVEQAKPPLGPNEHPYQTKPMSAQGEGSALPWKTENSSVR